MSTTPDGNGPACGRLHIVMVPGFGGFDVIGQLEYYAGTTAVYRDWYRDWLGKTKATGRGAVVLHYFDNLPTAGVATRAERLRAYLAKRIARGEIQPDQGDRLALVGHSTGGLDIRYLLFTEQNRELNLDGGAATGTATRTAFEVEQSEILEAVARVVFVSVPQWGTNIADWVRVNDWLRAQVVDALHDGVEGTGKPVWPALLSDVLRIVAAGTRDPDLVLAAEDALRETQASRADPILRAKAQEAASQLRLWLQHADDDFGAIDDLSTFTSPPLGSTSPAHYSEQDRDKELRLWNQQGIEIMSIATVGRRPFGFNKGEVVTRFALEDPFTWPTNRRVRRVRRAGEMMDVSYLFTYRACAGGSFRYPPGLAGLGGDIGNVNLDLFDEANLTPDGPKRGEAIELWDNDGIVNTASMLWPNGADTLLVAADHLDIVGHYVLRDSLPAPHTPYRRYASYDSLKSGTRFAPEKFAEVWQAVFDFCVA